MGKSNLSSFNVPSTGKDYTMFYKEFNKLKRTIGSFNLDTVFLIKYKGHEFNCLPFLLNGTGYFSNTYRSMLTDSISKLSSVTEPVYMSDIAGVGGLDLNVFHAILPALADAGIRTMGAYHYKECPKEMLRLLLMGSIEVFESVAFGGDLIHFEYNCDGICNTQAFSYYVSILWLLSLSPLLSSLSIRDLKRARFGDIINKILPEDSIHFKYICGELSSDDLLSKYTEESYSDGSSVCLREIMSNCTEGKYKGEDFSYKDLGMCNDIYDSLVLNESYKLNMHLAYCFLFDGTYERLNKEILTQSKAVERENEKVSKFDSRVKRLHTKIDNMANELKEKDKQIQELRNKLHSIKTNDTLVSEIKDLKSDNKKLKVENEQLFNERLSLKQIISTQKKEIKSLTARSYEDEGTDSDIVEDINESNEVGVDEAIEAIKDLRITYICCDNNTIENKLKSMGVVNVTRFNNQKTIGKCDVLVVFAIRCQHADVYKAEKLFGNRDIPIIYLNCVNVEQMIMAVYDTIFK